MGIPVVRENVGNYFTLAKDYEQGLPYSWILHELAVRNLANNAALAGRHGKGHGWKWSISADAVSLNTKTDLLSAAKRALPFVEKRLWFRASVGGVRFLT